MRRITTPCWRHIPPIVLNVYSITAAYIVRVNQPASDDRNEPGPEIRNGGINIGKRRRPKASAIAGVSGPRTRRSWSSDG